MKMKDKPQEKQYIIYSRKSKFTGKGESIENQIELCRQYIAVHFGEKAAKNALVYEDEGFSGGNLERPQFKKMMKDSQEIVFAAIVVYRLDPHGPCHDVYCVRLLPVGAGDYCRAYPGQHA